jgi:hypothetical protein
MAPDVDGSDRQKCLETCGNTLPSHDQATVLLLEPGNRPLGLKPRDHFFDRSAPVFLGLPDPLRDLCPDTPLPECLTQRFRLIACIGRHDFATLARAAPGAPCPHRATAPPGHAPLHGPAWGGSPRACRARPCGGGCGSLGRARPGRRPLPHPSQGEKAPSTAPYSQGILPCASAIPRMRACLAARVPSACPRCHQRGGARFDAHGGPRRTSHHRQPVSKRSSTVCSSVRQGAWGIPRRRF